MRRMRSRSFLLVAAIGPFFILTTLLQARGGAPDEGRERASNAVVLPAAQVNALAEKHCVVCHRGASPGGGLSFEGFDIARVDPAVARMMVVKIDADGAMGAAGVPMPDVPVRQAFVGALAAAGARPEPGAWTITLGVDGGGGHSVGTARAVHQAGGAAAGSRYELTLTCGGKSRQAGLQLSAVTTDASGVRAVRPLAVSPDAAMPLPDRTLALAGLPGETATFSFADLPPSIHRQLSFCFARP